MRVSFRRFPGHSSAYSVIERDDGVVYRMKEFTRAGTRLPHDLRHFVVERELGIADGIWGGIAAGMVYTSMDHVQGRRPPHAAERSGELQRARRQQLMRAELLANLVEAIAMLDAPSGDDIRRLTRTKLSAVPVTEPGADPADVAAVPPPEVLAGAARVLQLEAARWARLRVGEELVCEWRSPPRPREAGDRRDPRRTSRGGRVRAAQPGVRTGHGLPPVGGYRACHLGGRLPPGSRAPVSGRARRRGDGLPEPARSRCSSVPHRVVRRVGGGDAGAVGAARDAEPGHAPDRAPQSPLHGDLADLPPLLIVAGGDEALLDDARRFADAASAAGTLVTLDIYQDMVHAFHLSALPEAPPQVAIMFLDRLTAWTTALRHLG